MNRVALVLAAGSARRFGSDKLSASWRGAPLVDHAIRAARAAPVSRVVLVAHPALHVGPWTGWPPVDVLRLASPALSHSLQAGLDAAEDADAVFVFLGDMPEVPHDIAARLACAIGTAFAALPVCAGRPGHPVLLTRAAMALARDLDGDSGLGAALRGRGDVRRLACERAGVCLDIDHPEDLRD